MFSGAYSEEAAVSAEAFYETLSEKDRRQFVAAEARSIAIAIPDTKAIPGCFGNSNPNPHNSTRQQPLKFVQSLRH